MSRELIIRLIKPDLNITPTLLEKSLDVMMKRYRIRSIFVGRSFSNILTWWHSDKADKPFDKYDLACEHRHLGFFLLSHEHPLISASVDINWGSDQSKKFLVDIALSISDTAMFTKKMYEPTVNSSRVVELARHLYRAFSPDFLWIERAPENGYTLEKHVQNLEIPHIYWGNIFGPKYIDKYGRQFFQNAPAYRGEFVEDGGYLYVISPNLGGTGPNAVVEKVKSYFGVENVRVKSKK